MNDQPFSPKEFLRARRPEKFSDTIAEVEPQLDRSQLEYHLETLTSRSQEVEFQGFAHTLLEREICPNLLPQTGPTGGGDSKVDSETFPVADSLTLAWYTGIGREASSEHWAFAVSTKKKWRDKLSSDVAKIAATGRGYVKAFFVTSQFVSDKSRAQVEDKLRSKYGFDVRVLDRTWILDRVFKNQHQDLAIRELNLTVPAIPRRRAGPADARRTEELEALEQKIEVAVREGRCSPALVADCVHSAVLSRELERPRVETDGRFDRAARISEKVGNSYQDFECAYQRAWTTFWWYEDYHQLARLYADVEARAMGSRNSYDLERLANLWQLLHSSVKRGQLSSDESDLQRRTDRLTSELARLSKETSRPSTALQAETVLLQVQLALAGSEGQPVDAILASLRDVVFRSKGLVGYPLDPLVKIVTEFGEFFGNNPAYGELFETIVQVTSDRQQELTAAELLLTRGKERLLAGHPIEAIRALGRALRGLHKDESRQDSVRALYLCGCAYERLGLLWAARGTLLAAASLATDELWRYGEVTILQAACYLQLKWVELQLGRVPQALSWYECDRVVSRILLDKGHSPKHLAEQEQAFDSALAALLLRTDFWELKMLTSLPDVLDELGLPLASGALVYALGHEEELRIDGSKDAAGEDLHAVFLRYRDLPGWEDLAQKPVFCEGRKTVFETNLLGCHIILESRTDGPCLRTAESILAAFESVLATTNIQGMIAREPVLTGEVRASDFAARPVEFELQDRGGKPHLTVICSRFDPHGIPPETQAEIKKTLLDIVGNVIARVLFIQDVQKTLDELFRGELALERALDFTGSFVRLGNILGKEPKDRISDWITPGARDYPLERSNAWDQSDPSRQPVITSENESDGWTPGHGDPPAELVDPSHIKHRDIRTISLIREPLWNKAHWWGTMFLTMPDSQHAPILGLKFRSADAAIEIFEGWRRDVGTVDGDELLRVAIIRGISTDEPHSYRVAIGSNPDLAKREGSHRYIAFVSRINTMHPNSSENLDRFIESYGRAGAYYLAPAVGGSESIAPQVVWDHMIGKRKLHIRSAWEVGRHDPDAAAIHDDDTPLIPPGTANAPITGLLQKRRERHK